MLSSAPRHFLQFKDLSWDELAYVFERARVIKTRFKQYKPHHPLTDRSLAMIFEKSSTRTRLSFEAGIQQLGGSAIYLNTRDTQLGRGEPVEDAAQVISRMVDMVMIRENTEGTYAGEGGFLRKGTAHEVATQGSVNTRMGVERCVRYAFELARSRTRKHLTLVHKTNVLQFSGDLWQRTFNEVAAEYPDVATAYNHIDAACIYFVESPHRYDVIVTDNLFGDIITDLAGAVSGGVGLASSGNLNPARTGPSMFEPVHGSAPDIVGTGRADPRAAIISAGLLLEFLGEPTAARRIRVAIDATLTPSSTMPAGPTSAIGDHVASLV